MKTLIELYDERAIENVIGPEVFRPEKVIYICPDDIARDKRARENLNEFLASRGLNIKTEFYAASLYKSDRILAQLRKIAAANTDCAMDVTGGTDAALIAAGMFCSETGIPTFTYSRTRNMFYDISNAPFADGVPCELVYNVEEFFTMTGGKMRPGRVDNSVLSSYLPSFDGFFKVFLANRSRWNDDIIFMQRISQSPRGEDIPLRVSGAYTQKGEHGSRINADEAFLHDLEGIGYIRDLQIVTGEKVSFRFADHNVRAWLRDVGSVLELYMYKACRDSGIFNDVISSAVVDWDGTVGHDSVSNELDAVASRGVVPLFISCKACDVKTEALNELSILKERFGGKGAKAAIATTEPCNSAARHRAAQLGIAVIDLEELQSGMAAERLKVIMKVIDSIE